MNTKELTGYIPDRDLSIVSRILHKAGFDNLETIQLTSTHVTANDDTPDAALDIIAKIFASIPPAELQKSAEIAAGVTDADKLDALWEMAISGDAKKVDVLKAKIAEVALQASDAK